MFNEMEKINSKDTNASLIAQAALIIALTTINDVENGRSFKSSFFIRTNKHETKSIADSNLHQTNEMKLPLFWY